MTCRMSATLEDTDALAWHPLGDLPYFEARQVALHNRLLRSCAPWRGVLDGEPLQVRWGSAVAIAEPKQSTTVSLSLDGQPVELRVAADLLALSGWTRQSSATHPCADSDAMLLELAWLSWIEPLEKLLGVSLRVTAGDSPEIARAFAIPLEIRVGERAAFPASLHVGPETAERIAGWLDQHGTAAPDPLTALRFNLAVESGEAPLTLGELRSLNAGDVVMLDCPPDRQLRLRLGEHFQCLARRDHRTLECLAALAATSPDRNLAMTDTLTPDASELDAALDELPLKLVCQLGSVEVTLAQLREMGPGSLLQLTSAAQDGVDLMVNGRRVGRGELVSIGEGLGVRLLGFCAP